MTSHRFATFIARRALISVVLVFIISGIVFSLLYLTPGDLALTILNAGGGLPPTPEAIAAVHKEYHLDDPLPIQFLIWLNGAVHLDFGRSARTGEPVLSAIAVRLPVTLSLAAYAFVLTMIFGILLGTVAATRRGQLVDRIVVSLSVTAVSSPAFVTGIILLFLLGIVVPLFPIFGQGADPLDQLWHLTLPAVTLSFTGMAFVIRITRAAMITTLQQDYIVFARARGLSYWQVLFRYALRNSLNPLVTAAGLIFNHVMFGAVLIEVTFSLPGIGSLLVDAVNDKDIPVVQGVAMLIAVTVIAVNLVVDVLYLAIDPRVRFSRTVS